MAAFYKPVPEGGRSNVDLEKEAKALGPCVTREFKGVYSKDEMPVLGNNECVILNMADSDMGSGTHWVAAGIHNRQPWYFDSFGLGIPVNVMRQLGTTATHIVHYPTQIQANTSKLCGDFALGAIHAVAASDPTTSPRTSLGQFIRHMCIPNLKNNDRGIEQQLKAYQAHHSISGNVLYENFLGGNH